MNRLSGTLILRTAPPSYLLWARNQIKNGDKEERYAGNSQVEQKEFTDKIRNSLVDCALNERPLVIRRNSSSLRFPAERLRHRDVIFIKAHLSARALRRPTKFLRKQ